MLYFVFNFSLAENVLPITVNKHPLRREFTWMSGMDRIVEFRPGDQTTPYSVEIPAGNTYVEF